MDRRLENEATTINKKMKSVKVRGIHSLTLRDKNGDTITTDLKIKFEKMKLKPSCGLKSKNYSDIEVTVIFAYETVKSRKGREQINWKLMTNLPINDLEDAIEKLT